VVFLYAKGQSLTELLPLGTIGLFFYLNTFLLNMMTTTTTTTTTMMMIPQHFLATQDSNKSNQFVLFVKTPTNARGNGTTRCSVQPLRNQTKFQI
jgi:hypothetical protein